VSAEKHASVRVEHATFRYPGTDAGVFDVTLDIAPGELVVCIGPSGCGKTTLLKLIAGFLQLHAGRIRVAATSAVRDADNREEFAAAVLELTGSELEVISGEREAGLSFLGGTHRLEASTAPPPYLVLDIGGWSTELVVGAEPGRAERAISMRMGSVRLTERFVHHDPPRADELAQLLIAVDEVLDDAQAHVPVRDARTLIAVAGTATTLQAIALGLDRYDPEAIHRTWLTLGTAQAVLDDLVRMTTPERAALAIMAPGRGDVIVAGGVILVTVMRRFGFDRALVSETDILDGLAYETVDIG
jgi:exopolyphosphatase/guanosine-5'-triphosphate,3'-diphosphate pyrophosphatase